MTELYDVISFEEKVALKLRVLFERFGYREYKMGKFESYEIYQENVNYLKSNSIITFTDSKGHLMALKPDVTMSIVNNIQEDKKIEKLYYVENVFRRNTTTGDYQELGQIGMEFIGQDGGYSEVEALMLALRSLQIISDDFILDLSHMGYMQGLLESCGIEENTLPSLVKEISRKNQHGIMQIGEKAGLSEVQIDALCKACNLPADHEKAVATAREIAVSVAASDEVRGLMLASVDELETLYRIARDMGMEEKVRLDFSVTNDLDYYNGLLMRGYIAQVPYAILTGGRYDNLMKKVGNNKPAIGFALNMQGLRRAFHVQKEYDADVKLIYGDAPLEAVAAKVRELTGGGKSVITIEKDDETIRARETVAME